MMPNGTPEHDGDHDRRAHQDQRGWDPFPDLLGDRSPGLDREPEVALDRGHEPADVADRHRLIQPVLLAPLLEQLRVALDLLELFRRQASQQGSPGARDSAKKLMIVIPIRTGIAMRIRRTMYVPTGQLG